MGSQRKRSISTVTVKNQDKIILSIKKREEMVV
jgi:hypothetical protein